MVGAADAIDLFLASQDRPIPASELSDLLAKIRFVDPCDQPETFLRVVRDVALQLPYGSVRRPGLFLWADGNLQDAAAHFAKAIGDERVDPMLVFDATQFWVRQQQFYIARALFLLGCSLSGEEEMPSVLDLFSELSEGLWEDNQTSAALALLADTEALVLSNVGRYHQATFYYYHRAAVFFSEKNRNDEAVPFLREATEIGRKIFGEMHPETLRTAFVLALTLEGAGRITEAAEAGKEAMERWRDAGGNESLQEAMALVQETKRLAELMNGQPPKKSWKSW